MNLKNEAMVLLEKRGAILETARRISALLHDNKIPGAIIGGIAVLLHGHVRTTTGVDLWVRQPEVFENILKKVGARRRRKPGEFSVNSVPVQLVDNELVQPAPKRRVMIDGILTVSLADLVSLKLHSGMSKVTRVLDLGDVIGLIENRKLPSAFAAKLDKSVRGEFKKLVSAVRHNT